MSASAFSIAQRSHIQNYLNVLKGMVSESMSKQSMLNNRLRQFPEKTEQIKNDTTKIETELDCINLLIDFITDFPLPNSYGSHQSRLSNLQIKKRLPSIELGT